MGIITSCLLHYHTTSTTLSSPAIMQHVFLVVFVLVASASAQLGKCPYWQAGYGNPNVAHEQTQNVLSDGSIAGNWNILTADKQVLESASYTSEKQKTTDTTLTGTANGPCPYWENFYGGSSVELRSHRQYNVKGNAVGEFQLLSTSEGTVQTIKYTLK